MNGPATGAVIDVLAPGLQTTVQDLGRWGYQAEGVPVAGAMDPFAHRLANAVVGNARDAATLEITLTGPELRFNVSRRIAVAGAEFLVFLDGDPVPHATAVAVPEGATLRFGARRRGARAYLAVEGGLVTPATLGSRATHVPSGTGGMCGRAIVTGDRLPVGAPVETTRPQGRPEWSWRALDSLPSPDSPIRVRVRPGPQDDRFAAAALDVLVSAPYTIASDANRMGYRLAGPVLTHREGADIIPDATPLGALQVPASGQPVLLMADRQTTGGYAKLAVVIASDIPLVAQAAPGDRLAFELCTRAEALRALIARERQLLAVEPR